MTEILEVTEIIEVKEIIGIVEIIEVTEIIEITENAEVTEIAEACDIVEITKKKLKLWRLRELRKWLKFPKLHEYLRTLRVWYFLRR